MRPHKPASVQRNPLKLTNLLLLAGYGAVLGSFDVVKLASAEEFSSEASLLTPAQNSKIANDTATQAPVQPLQEGTGDVVPVGVEQPSFSDEEEVADSSVDSLSSAKLPAEIYEALEIPARFNLKHQSSSAGLDGITGFGGFIPLDQTPGETITFLEGDLLLDNGGNLGWSVDIGHRGFDGDIQRIRGGYLGFDGRSTDESTFYQLAAGYERLAEDWDFRLNGYVPLGQSLNTLSDTTTEGISQINSGFENNQLVLSAVNERRRIRQEEEALGGFDAEVATQLSQWDGGELTGAAGGYWLSGENSSWGGQLRLAANFKSNFKAGVALQHDGIFGTNFVVSIGASWPKIRFQKDEEQEFQETYETPIRLRDSIHRRETVPVEQRTDVDVISESSTEPLRNPEEEQDYRFLHVALGGSSGDGTYEAPFSTVEDAIALINSDPATYSDGNTILYVDGEAAPTTAIPGFAIPDRVRVLSQGPQQTIGGMLFPGFPADQTRLPFASEDNFNIESNAAPNANGIAVLLPDSGDGVFPLITGGAADLVTLGNRTVLAGFQLENATQHGVTGSNTTNAELRNNRIANSAGSGIFLDNVGGSVILLDNEITGSGDRGIFAQNSTTSQSVNITIAGYELANNRVGMEFATTANNITTGAPAQIVSVGPSSADNTSVGNPSGALLSNSILNSAAEGVIVSATGASLGTSSSQEFSFDQGTVSGSGAVGISISANVGAHAQEINITNSNISDNAGAGIVTVVGTPPTGSTQTASTQEFVVRNSTISNNNGAGIEVGLADSSSQELVIRGNTITNNAGDGISSLAQNVSIQEWRNDLSTGDVGASENVISGNGGQGIDIDAQDLAVLPVVGIADNQVTGNSVTPDIAISTTSTPLAVGSPTTCAVIRGNTVTSSIQLTGLTTAATGGLPSFQVQDLANVIAANNGSAIVFASNTATPDTTPFENEAGNCID